MYSYPRRPSAGGSARMAQPRLLILLVSLMALASMSGCFGCGGNEAVETDNTMMDTGGTEPMDNVDLGEDTMGGATTGQDMTEPEDVEESSMAQPAVVLQDVFFDFDKYDLSAEARDKLAANSRMLRDNPNARILIEGHCDERGTVQYNLALGEKRANEARSYLTSLGISPTRIEVVSYGKERPFAMGHTEAAWSQNRRAHFVVH